MISRKRVKRSNSGPSHARMASSLLARAPVSTLIALPRLASVGSPDNALLGGERVPTRRAPLPPPRGIAWGGPRDKALRGGARVPAGRAPLRAGGPGLGAFPARRPPPRQAGLQGHAWPPHAREPAGRPPDRDDHHDRTQERPEADGAGAGAAHLRRAGRDLLALRRGAPPGLVLQPALEPRRRGDRRRRDATLPRGRSGRRAAPTDLGPGARDISGLRHLREACRASPDRSLGLRKDPMRGLALVAAALLTAVAAGAQNAEAAKKKAPKTRGVLFVGNNWDGTADVIGPRKFR